MKALLIGGTSHSGKSTLARSVAGDLGWEGISTDSLARHPGRPWRAMDRDVPADVVAHYGQLTVDELMRSVTSHYEAMWPTLIEPLLVQESDPSRGLVLEGSALLPSKAAQWIGPQISAIWLTANEELLEARIMAQSRYASLERDEQVLVRQFLARAIAFDAFTKAEVARLNLPSIDIGAGLPEQVLRQQCLDVARLP